MVSGTQNFNTEDANVDQHRGGICPKIQAGGKKHIEEGFRILLHDKSTCKLC